MPRGDGTGPHGNGPHNESGHCEGRGRKRHNVREPLGEHKCTHERHAMEGRPGGRRRCRDRRREDCDHTHHQGHGHHHGDCEQHHHED